jgi:hypothetical protein
MKLYATIKTRRHILRVVRRAKLQTTAKQTQQTNTTVPKTYLALETETEDARTIHEVRQNVTIISKSSMNLFLEVRATKKKTN